MGKGCRLGKRELAAGVVAPLKASPRYRLPSTSRVVRQVSCPSTGGSADSVQKSRSSTCTDNALQDQNQLWKTAAACGTLPLVRMRIWHVAQQMRSCHAMLTPR